MSPGRMTLIPPRLVPPARPAKPARPRPTSRRQVPAGSGARSYPRPPRRAQGAPWVRRAVPGRERCAVPAAVGPRSRGPAASARWSARLPQVTRPGEQPGREGPSGPAAPSEAPARPEAAECAAVEARPAVPAARQGHASPVRRADAARPTLAVPRPGRTTQRHPRRTGTPAGGRTRRRSRRRVASMRSTAPRARSSARSGPRAPAWAPVPVGEERAPPAAEPERRRRDTRVPYVPPGGRHRAPRGRQRPRGCNCGAPRGGCPARPQRSPARRPTPASTGQRAATAAPRPRTPPPTPAAPRSDHRPPGATWPTGARCSARPDDPCRATAARTRRRRSAAHGRRQGCPRHAAPEPAAERRPRERHGTHRHAAGYGHRDASRTRTDGPARAGQIGRNRPRDADVHDPPAACTVTPRAACWAASW